jgi:hypothetical protein
VSHNLVEDGVSDGRLAKKAKYEEPIRAITDVKGLFSCLSHPPAVVMRQFIAMMLQLGGPLVWIITNVAN